MGFISNLLFGGPDSSQEISEISRRAVERGKHKKPGIFSKIIGRTDPQFHREVADKVRGDQRIQYYEHERQLQEQERQHRDIVRPRHVYELEQSYRIPYYKEEVARLKQENSPYAAHAEEQLKYAQESVNNYLHTYDHEHERELYNKKWEFQQQQKEFADRTFEQAQEHKERYAEESKRRESIQQALHTQSNIGRGGNAGRKLGEGNRFSRLSAPKARGSYGRGGRSSFTSPGR